MNLALIGLLKSVLMGLLHVVLADGGSAGLGTCRCVLLAS